jgi:hypothetical protein
MLNEEKLLTCETAGKILGLSRDYLRLLCWNGSIKKASKIGNNWVFPHSSIEDIKRKRVAKKLKHKTEGTKMVISSTLQNLHSLDEVIDLINQDGTNEFNGDQIAAQYAMMAIEESKTELSDVNVSFHLDVLVENGANFEYTPALKLALTSGEE